MNFLGAADFLRRFFYMYRNALAPLVVLMLGLI